MKVFKIATAMFVVAVLAFALVPGMKAGNDAWNMKTTLVFTQAFEVPGGQVLPAGAYTFKLLDSAFDRNYVQIMNVEQTQVYALVHTNPFLATAANEKTVVKMAERSAGAPSAIKLWLHPGERMGHEFPVATEGVIVTYEGD
jgi:hypothetical protein